MSDLPSAELLERFRQHDPAAANELFHRYAERLTRLARARLSRSLSARLDPEDVVQSAYRSFFLLAAEGVELRESGDLWRLLARITVRKVCRSARRHRADCRSVLREEGEAEESAALSREPTPGDEVALDDELRCLLAPLAPIQKQIAELRLLGHDAEEIAARVERTSRTVRRVLVWLGEELQHRLAAPPATEPTRFDYSSIVLHQLLGAGGMGKVYRASVRGLLGPVAVKLLRKPLRGNATTSTRFLDEAGLLARLRHPGIVSVHGLGLLPDGGHFLVMDLVEAGDLGAYLEAGPIALADALRWTAEAADAADYAHREGVIHCDLKPSNLLLDAAGRIRVSDFGLAKSLNASAIGGTAGYMAPEQACGDPVSPRTDVYGLGAVLFALVNGRPPYSGDSLAATRIGIPDKVETLWRQCLAVDPADRPESAAAVAGVLRSLEALLSADRSAASPSPVAGSRGTPP